MDVTEQKTTRVTLSLAPSMIEAVEERIIVNYRETGAFASRSEMIRRLIEIGLKRANSEEGAKNGL